MRVFTEQCRTKMGVACQVLLLVALPILLSLSTVTFAQQPDSGQSPEQLATVCAACHGIDGNSTTTIWPKLAEQHASYIARQTRMVRDGQRSVPVMLGIVAGLSDADIDKISGYFAEQQIKPGVADEDLVALGKGIYQSGLPAKGVPACQACHGPVGNGNPASQYPMLAGQHADYTAARLKSYRSGVINGEDDPYSPQMVLIAENLGDHEIEAVSSYLEGLYDQRQ